MSNIHNNSQAESFRHVRKNPVTREDDYFFPMEITDPSIRALARERGLEISRTRLGHRTFDAVMVPCKDTATVHGVEIFVDTPSEVQRQRYLELIKDELVAQDAAKQDGRCMIPDAYGGLKRCPCRMKNPAYVPDGAQPKTLPVKCQGCKYEEFRQAHTTIVVSALDHENEVGEFESFEIPATKDMLAADRFLELRQEFITFVREPEKIEAIWFLCTQDNWAGKNHRLLSAPAF